MRGKHIILFIALAIFSYIVYSLLETFLDDAFITLTYSKHFFEFSKPWYNMSDEIQGNGQTSVLWMIIQSSSFYFKSINPIYINKTISICCSILLIIFSFKIITKHEKLPFFLLKALFLIFFAFGLALNVSHGLETILYTFFIFLYLYTRNKKINYLIVFLLPFIRPEGIIFFTFFIWDTAFFSKEFFKRVTLCLVSICTYFIYTQCFYDILIPLPFTLKNTADLNIVKVENFIITSFIFTPLWVFLYFNRNKVMSYIPLIFFIVYYSFFIDEVMNVFDRYRFPLMIYFIYFFLKENVSVNICFRKSTTIAIAISFIAILIKFNNLNNQKKVYKYQYSLGMINGPIYIGKFLKKQMLTRQKKLSVINSDAGAIAFYSDCNIYDTWGLNCASLLYSKKKKEWENYLNYIRKANPDYIILISKSDKFYQPLLDFENKIYRDLNLDTQKPNLIRKFHHNYYYFLYKTK